MKKRKHLDHQLLNTYTKIWCLCSQLTTNGCLFRGRKIFKYLLSLQIAKMSCFVRLCTVGEIFLNHLRQLKILINEILPETAFSITKVCLNKVKISCQFS